jgi:hypothetical protein
MTKRKFTGLFIFLVFAATFISCNKDNGNTNPAYQIKADFDGSEKVFSVLTSAAESTPDNLFNLTLFGIGATESISLHLWSDKDDFVAGKTFTITGPAGKENAMAYGLNGAPDSTQSYYSHFKYGTVAEQLDCTITERTPTYIKGTFSGKLYKNQTGIPQKIEVTNGSFFVPFD